MTDSWVGFRASPRRDKSRPKVTETMNLSSTLEAAAVVGLITTQQGLSQWLGEVTKFDSKLGGKIRFNFEDEIQGATFSRIDIPRAIILVTDVYGELDFSLKSGKSGVALKLKVSRAANEAEKTLWISQLAGLEARLSRALGHV